MKWLCYLSYTKFIDPKNSKYLFNDCRRMMRINDWLRLLKNGLLANVILIPAAALLWMCRSLFWRSSIVGNPLHPSQEHRHTLVKLDNLVRFSSPREEVIHPAYFVFSDLVKFLQPSWCSPSISRVMSISPAQLFTCNGPSIAKQCLQPPKHFCKPVLHLTSSKLFGWNTGIRGFDHSSFGA